MLEMEIIEPNMLEMELNGQIPSTIGGTTNYNELSSKPKINGVELKGDKSLEELGIDLNNTLITIKHFLITIYHFIINQINIRCSTWNID